MALTPAEKQKAYRERQKERLKSAPDAARSFIVNNFAAFLERADPQELIFIDDTLDSIGLEIGTPLTTDVDPGWREEWEDFGSQNLGALSRAERMVGGFLDMARVLAELINQFKLREIETALQKQIISILLDQDHLLNVIKIPSL